MLDRTIQPTIKEPELFRLQHAESSVLPNGVPLHVIQGGESEVVRIDILMNGGRWHQEFPLQTLFCNRMLREGTERFSASQLAEKLDYYGAWLELSSSWKHTYTTLFSLNKYLPQTLEVLESMIKEPVFPQSQLDVVVRNNLQQFRVNTSKTSTLAQRALQKNIMGVCHPCGRMIEEEYYHALNPEMLRRFFQRYYHAKNCTIYLSGKVTEDCIHRIEQIFGTEQFGSAEAVVPADRVYPIQSVAEKRIFVERSEAMQSAVRMGALSVNQAHPDSNKLRVLLTLFGGYFGSRLMQNIREEKGYTYGINSGMINLPDCGLWVVQSETGHEFVEPLIREVYTEIERLRQDLVPDAELATVKNYMLGDSCRSYESAFSIADAWIYAQSNDLPADYYDDSLAAIKEVTPAELRELACRYFNPEALLEVVSGKKL